jgi:membrane protein DedA with SNARE-associated domain
VRNFSSFALGISGIDWRRFLIFNFIAALLWATSFVGAGYFCGRAAERMLGELAEKISIALLGIFIVVVIAVFVTQRVRSRLKRQRREAAEAASP